ncbi:PH domain-containing protein [Patescibacteria group bacterium]|nr:MAG: PH domain-containing protein [Patescibacteria group bacterium]
MHFPFLIKIHGGEMEKPAIFMRKHPLILFGQSLLYLALLTGPYIAYLVLRDVAVEWLNHPTLGPAVLLLVTLYDLFVLLLFYAAYMDWYLDIWVVTNERIVDVNQHGVFGREIAELQLSKVQDVASEQKGVFATIFHYGLIRVQSAGEKAQFEFAGIPYPHDIARKILELVQADQKWHREALAQEIKGTQ